MSKNYKFLNNVNFPSDIRKLSQSEIKVLADEVRQELIDVVSEKPKGNGDNSSSDYDYGFSKEKVSNVPSGKKEVPVSQEADF